MEEVERLLVRGRVDEAWTLVESRLSRMAGARADLDFLVECWLLAFYYRCESDRIDSWPDITERRLRERPVPDPRGLAVADAIRLSSLLRHASLQSTGFSSRLDLVDWDRLHDFPVLLHYRAHTLFRIDGRVDEATRRLDEVSFARDDFLGRAHNFVIRVEHCSSTGSVEEAERMAQLANSHAVRVEGLIGRIFPCVVAGKLAMMHTAVGDYGAAARNLESLESICDAYNLVQWRAQFVEQKASLLLASGRLDDARDLLRKDPLPIAKKWRESESRIQHRLINRGFLWTELGEWTLAERALARCSRSLKSSPDDFRTALVTRHRGRISIHRGHRGGLARGVALLRRAEGELRRLGPMARNMLVATLADLADAHLRRGHVGDSVECLRECLHLTDDLRDLGVKARCVLLKSYLLLERGYDHSREDLYEEVLRELGVIHSPVVLFETIANLYMFSWDLGERLDITELHHRQIQKLREALDDDVFADMYQKHVRCRVILRAKRKPHGQDPDRRTSD